MFRLHTTREHARRLHARWALARTGSRRRERGTITVEKLIMIGLIVVPLVVLLIIFKNKVTTFFGDTINNLFSTSQSNDNAGSTGGGLNLPATGK